MYPCTHHAHTLPYPSCIRTILGKIFTNHSNVKDKSWTVIWWFLKTNSTICAVFTCSLSAWLKSSNWMPTDSWTLCTFFLNYVVSIHHPQTPALTGIEFQAVKFSADMDCQKTKLSAWQYFLYHYNCTYTYPLNSMISWLLHHLLHVTSIAVCSSHHKMK